MEGPVLEVETELKGDNESWRVAIEANRPEKQTSSALFSFLQGGCLEANQPCHLLSVPHGLQSPEVWGNVESRGNTILVFGIDKVKKEYSCLKIPKKAHGFGLLRAFGLTTCSFHTCKWSITTFCSEEQPRIEALKSNQRTSRISGFGLHLVMLSIDSAVF